MIDSRRAAGIILGLLVATTVASIFIFDYSTLATVATIFFSTLFYALLWKSVSTKDANSLTSSADAQLLSSLLQANYPKEASSYDVDES